MSTTAAEIIDITPTSRLRVEYDTDATNPRIDGYTVAGALTLSGPRNERDVAPVYYFPGDLRRAFEEIPAPADGRFEPDNIFRWARLAYQVTLVWDQARGTYWWADPEQMKLNWPELTAGSEEYVAKEREVIESERATYSTWCDGDVYGVILERLAEWHRTVDSVHHVRTEWEEVDALWGCYLDDTYTAQQVALDDFPLTDDERAALTTDHAKEASPTQ